MVNVADGGSGSVSNVVAAGPGYWNITIDRQTVRVPDGTLVLTPGGLVAVEDAAAGGATVERLATEEEKQQAANEATSGAGIVTDTGDTDVATPPPGGGTGGTGAGGGGGGGSSAPKPGAAAEDDTGFRGVPPDGKLYRVDGRVYWGREILDPTNGQVVGFAGWHIPTTEDLEALLGDTPMTFEFDGTLAEAEARGFVDGGVLSEVSGGPEDDPLENWIEDWTEQLSLSPMFDDPEIIALATIAAIEGREITPNELEGTDWWRSQNEAQRAWAELVASDPAQAALIQRNNRDTIRERFWQAGWSEVPDSLVDYVADQWTSGLMSQADAFRQVERESDPYAAGASPYAGLTAESFAANGWSVITDGTDYWVRTEDGDYKVNGPGGQARYAGMAQEITTAPDGAQHVTQNGQHYLMLADGTVLKATGPGQIAGLTRVYGEAQEFVPNHYGRTEPTLENAVSGTVVDYFGGAGGIEAVGEINEVGTADQLAAGADGRDTVGLGEEERVRELLRQYVGPYHAANYSDTWVAEQAGKLRNEGPGAIDVLTQQLQRDFQSLFPGYDGNNVSYESIAGPSRGLWQRYSGNEVDEDNTAWLEFLSLGPNAQNREGWLRSYGLQEGWAPANQQALSGLMSQAGSQVRRSLV